MSVEVDYTRWGPITLAPGEESLWWFTWIFDSNHWSRMSASPDNYPASLEIVREWTEKDIWGTTKHWMHWRNNGTTPVAFRPKVIVAPSRY